MWNSRSASPSIAPGKETKRVYFGNSGAEATEAAIKLARYHTKRDKLIAFYGSFHGRTMGALSLTASKSVQRKDFGSLLAGVFHAHYPNTYRGTFGHNPEHAAADALDYIHTTLFKRIVDPEDVAGIIVEPIQGEGGYLPAPAEFLQGLQTHLPRARHHADHGRSAIRHGPHRQVVGLRTFGYRAGHHLHREGNR